MFSVFMVVVRLTLTDPITNPSTAVTVPSNFRLTPDNPRRAIILRREYAN